MNDFNSVNPILKCDYPDPDVIRVGDTFYMISTTMYYMPGGVILKSFNLIDWEIESYVFDSIEGNDAERLENGLNCYGQGMWAPTLRFHEGRFYVAFVSKGRDDTHLYISDSVKGPWEHRLIKGYYHDCSLLFDEGRVFIVHGNTEIRLTELSEDLRGPKDGGIDKVIIKDEPGKVYLGYEGAHFYRIKDKYVITLIHWPKYNGVRTEAVYVSDTVDGEYKGCDVLGEGMGVAQGGLVDDTEGNWYSVMFRDSGAVGRIPVIVPVSLSGEFPVWGDAGRIPATIETPDLKPGYKYEPLYTSDDFSEPIENIKKQWQWNHVPNLKFIKTVSDCENDSNDTDGAMCINTVADANKNESAGVNKNEIADANKNQSAGVNIYECAGSNENKSNRHGGLQITTDCIAGNILNAHNTLTQRMMAPVCAAEVTLDAGSLNVGDTAGLATLTHAYGFVGIRREEEGFSLIQLVNRNKETANRIGDVSRIDEQIYGEIRLNSPRIRLRIETDFTDMNDTVRYFYIDEKGRHRIGDDHKIFFALSHFTGARFALFAYSTKEAGGRAVFTDFLYEYNPT